MKNINYNFHKYNPQWVEYKSIEKLTLNLFKSLIGQNIKDIRGITSQYGWEPDWPIIIHFEKRSISFMTKCDYL